MTLKTLSPSGFNQRLEKSPVYSRLGIQRICHQPGKPEAVLSISKALSSHLNSLIRFSPMNPIPGGSSGANILGDGKPINCEFHISESSSYSLIGLKVIRKLGVSVCLLLPSSTASSEEINKPLATCDNATGGIAKDPIHLETEGDPNFLKRRILSYGLREPVRKELMKLQKMNKDGVTPIICGDYLMTVNKVFRNYISTTEDILNRFESSKVFSVIDLRNAFLQVPLDEASKQLTTISIWSLCIHLPPVWSLGCSSYLPKSGGRNNKWLNRSPRASRRFNRIPRNTSKIYTASSRKQCPNQSRSNINPLSRIYN